MDRQQVTPVVFNGTAREYFGIWIVNLLLSLITLGIYSAWAKVRRKKYFYNNTLIANVGFDYHANPIGILKGRIIAFIFFLGYAFSQNIHPYLPATFMLVFFIALPWLVIRATVFNARNTSHRGLRFDFDGTLSQAVKTFILFPLLTVFSLGLAAPYASWQKNKFLMNSHKFGTSHFDMQAKIKAFYLVYLKLAGILIVLSILFSVLVFTIGKDSLPFLTPQPPAVLGLTDTTTQPVITAEQEAAEAIQEITDDGLLEEQAELTPDEPNLDADLPADNNEGINDPDRDEADKKLEEMMKNPGARWAIFAGIVAYLLFIFIFVSYFQARIGNLVWNSTRLDNIGFESSLRGRDLLWLYFSNLLAIMLTFGLATPWAQIRAVRYRASKLALVGDIDFDQFVGDKKAEAKAMGEEIADMFDIDLSFG
jgi:uncharacterized membrane protein YjgN (DUF898 family)